MTHTRAIVFDLDDTLYLERSYAFSGFEAVAAKFERELDMPAGAAVARMKALFDTEHRPRVFNRLLEELGVTRTPDLVARMVETYRSHVPTIAMLPDAEAAITRWKCKCKLGIITDGPAVMQSAKLDALGLRDRMDSAILTDLMGPSFSKPHARSFEMMADQLGVPHERCAYIADNPTKDFVAPNALGWLTVQITRSEGIYRDQPPAPGGTPRHVISTLDDLDRVLDA